MFSPGRYLNRPAQARPVPLPGAAGTSQLYGSLTSDQALHVLRGGDLTAGGEVVDHLGQMLAQTIEQFLARQPALLQTFGNAAAQPLLQPELTNASIFPSPELAARLIPERAKSEEYVRLRTRMWTRFRTGQ